MKIARYLVLFLFLIGGIPVWSEESPQDDAAFSLLKLDRAGLLRAIGTPLEEVTDPGLTQALWDSVVVQKDREAGSYYLYFLAKDRVTAFASIDSFAKAHQAELDEDLDGLKQELEGQGYVSRSRADFSGPRDLVYFDPKAGEWVGARVTAAEDGASLLSGLYTSDEASLGPVGQATAELYARLQTQGR
jgi:hypothetical protein